MRLVILIVEYAWIELNRQIIDPTLPLNKIPVNFTTFPAQRQTVKQQKQQ